jgi:hypothetical protein
MNAMLTWWSVSLALVGHAGLGNEVLGRDALLGSVPLFIAALVWLIRVLLIGTLTLAGGRLFSLGQRQVVRSGSQARQAHRPAGAPAPAAAARSSANGRPLSRQEPRPAPRQMARASSRR